MSNSATTNQQSWNAIDLELIKQNNQQEITRLYQLLKPYYLKFYSGNEELFNDLILKLIDNVGSFKGESLFSTWIFRIGIQMRDEQFRKDKTEKKRHAQSTDAYQELQYQEFSVQNKIELETFISHLRPKSQEFLENYLTDKSKYTQQRNTYSYTLRALKSIQNKLTQED